MNTPPTTPPDDTDDLPPSMQTTAQLQNNLGKFTAFAAALIAKAERIDVHRDFAADVKTKFRKPRQQIIERSRLLRQQAGEVFSRIDRINAELEFREEHTPGGLRVLSFETRAVIKETRLVHEPMTMKRREAVKKPPQMDFAVPPGFFHRHA